MGGIRGREKEGGKQGGKEGGMRGGDEGGDEGEGRGEGGENWRVSAMIKRAFTTS